MNIKNPTELYAEIIKEFELDDLTPEMQIDILGDITDLLMQGLLVQATVELDDEHIDKLNELLGDENDTQEKTDDEIATNFISVMSFLETNLPDFEARVVNQIATIKSSMK